MSHLASLFIVIAAASAILLSGCSSKPPEPSKKHGLSRTRQTNQIKDEAPFIKKMIANFPKTETPAPATDDGEPTTEPKAGNPMQEREARLQELRKKYGIRDVESIDSKDRLGIMEIYAEDIRKIQAAVQ